MYIYENYNDLLRSRYFMDTRDDDVNGILKRNSP